MSDDQGRGGFDPALVTRLVGVIRGPARPVVLIDGGSGSGKSTLAGPLAAALGADLVHLEDVYPGWDGLEDASAAVHTQVLEPGVSGWRAWDWQESRPADWHDVNPDAPLVVEGSGALSAANRRLATFGIWLRLDDDTRRLRALARDGDRYAPHWQRWALQEARFALREQPHELADAVIDVETGQVVLNKPT